MSFPVAYTVGLQDKLKLGTSTFHVSLVKVSLFKTQFFYFLFIFYFLLSSAFQRGINFRHMLEIE